MILPHWTYRDMVHWIRYRRLIPNLKRKNKDKLPHGSYYNRGEHRRYLRIIQPYLTKSKEGERTIANV